MIGVLCIVFVAWCVWQAKKLDGAVKITANQFMNNPQNSGVPYVAVKGVRNGKIPAELNRSCKLTDTYQQISGAPYGMIWECKSGTSYIVQINSPNNVSVSFDEK